MDDAPVDVRALAAQRADARAAKDYESADEIRARIAASGWAVVDEPQGWRLEPLTPVDGEPDDPIRSADVTSVLAAPATADVSVHWVLEGWPLDVVRAIASFRAHAGDRDVQYVVVDTTGDLTNFGDDVEVVRLETGTGWAAARNAGLKRSKGRSVLAMDGSVEVSGDVFSPLEATLADPSVGLIGPFGIVTGDLHQFDEAPGPGDCDAIEGYLMAMRREVLTDVGLFDEKFTWYRTADIEYSFRVKDHGLRTVVVPAPVVRHEHRMWFGTDPADRARWSKRNFYRFLDRWRDRWDLTVAGEPPRDQQRHDA